MNVTRMSQLEGIHHILLSGSVLDGQELRQLLFIQAYSWNAGTRLFWVATKLYPAKIETKTINGKSLKFQILGCLFLTRSCMLLWTHLFHPEVNSYSLKSVWPAIFGWSISVWKITTVTFFQSSGWLSSIPHKFSEIVSVTFKLLCFRIQNICDLF